MMGPNLWGVTGRTKPSAAGFKYSPALTGLGGQWTYEDLDAFLDSPAAFAQGAKMSFAGVKDGEKRAEIIAFLR